MAQLSTFDLALRNAETELLKSLAKYNDDLGSGNPIEAICGRLSALLAQGRRIRAFRSIYTVPKSAKSVVDHRSQEIVFVKAINEFVKPQKCVFHATELSEDERRYLNASGINAESAQSVLESSTDGFAENEVEICWVTFCNPFLLNELIRKRWANLSKTVFIGLRTAFNEYEESFNEEDLFSFRLDTTGYQICAFIPKTTLPESFPEPTSTDYMLMPFYKERTVADEHLLEEMAEFAHINANIQRIEKKIDQDGFIASYVADLQKLLDGRTLKRIKIVGIGNFATCYQPSGDVVDSLHQLAFVLAVKKHFNVSISFQEPRATPFEKEFLNSLEIATPEADDLQAPEEGLAENEVTLFFMSGLEVDQNSVCWANRKAMRNIMMVGSGKYSDSIRPTLCDICEDIAKRIRDAAEALQKFYEEIDEIPFYADDRASRPYQNSVWRNMSRGKSTMSYKHRTLPVSDEKPSATLPKDLDFANLKNCTCNHDIMNCD